MIIVKKSILLQRTKPDFKQKVRLKLNWNYKQWIIILSTYKLHIIWAAENDIQNILNHMHNIS